MNFTNKDAIAVYKGYQSHYSEKGFWQTLKNVAKKLGEKGISHALVLYYSLQDPSVPSWCKGIIVGALGYLIFPADALPDFIPVVGLMDDFALLAAAVAYLELHIPDNARKLADRRLKECFCTFGNSKA